jgi:hypothetical protein
MVDRGNKGAAILGGISRSVNVERVARAPPPACRRTLTLNLISANPTLPW